MANLRVLNLDDNRIARYARSVSLRRAGFDVLEAGTGGEALKLVDVDQLDVAILDVNLPDMSGLEVTRRIKADPLTRSIKVVQISAGCLSEADELSSLHQGADIYLRGPIEPDALSAVIDTLGRIRRSEIMLAENAPRETQKRKPIVGAAQFDMAGYVMATNQGYCDMVKRTSQELCLLPLQELVHPGDSDRVSEMFREMIRGNGEDFRIEMRQVAGDGSVLLLDCSFSVMRSIAGVVRGALCAVISAKPAWHRPQAEASN